ncbi:MAG: FkbM family methyltransferase [Candidatus Omnitrophica bacterium]|nr:FkbM family methyltransferase [Candidatus Omnitrophota bacterium]
MRFNEARKRFLDRFVPALLSEEEPRTALDVGCGFGYFTRYLAEVGWHVTGLDGRQRNILEAQRRYPDVRFIVENVEEVSAQAIGQFDAVFCLGVLYHLENPFRAVRALYEVTRRYLVIDTIVIPNSQPSLMLFEEGKADNQGLHYTACVPSESALVLMLYKAGFAAVYRPDGCPDHNEYVQRIGRHRMRRILIATKDVASSGRRWGSVTFSMMPQPRGFLAVHATWNTVLGEVTSVFIERKVFALKVFDRLCRALPTAWGLWLCERAARTPVSCRWPGWKLGSAWTVRSPTMLLRRALWRWFSRMRSGDFRLAWYNGLRVLAYPQDEVCRSIFLTRCYEPNEFAWLRRILEPGMTVIDVGAHFGLYTLCAARAVGERGVVIAIEPSQREVERLKRNLDLNSVRNVRVRAEALHNTECEVSLAVAAEGHSGRNTLGEFADEDTWCLRREARQARRLDAVVQEERLSSVDLIKMDVEGAELFVLHGALDTLLRFRPTLMIELSDRSLQHQSATSRQVLEFLEGLGYRIFQFDTRTGALVPCRQERWHEGERIVAVQQRSVEPLV